MRKAMLTAVPVAFAVLLASFAPRAWAPAQEDAAAPSVSSYELTLAAPALPAAPPADAH